MENKNITFGVNYNTFTKKHFTGSYEKSVGILDELQDTILKGRKVNNRGKNYWTSISLNLKNRHV